MAKGGFLPNDTSHVNKVLTKPTFIPFAAGGVLAGEAGKEAVMPLTRTSSGNLGVEASGLKGGQGVTVNIHEAPGTRANVQTSDDGMNVDVFIEQIENTISGRISRGTGLGSFLDSRYRRRM